MYRSVVAVHRRPKLLLGAVHACMDEFKFHPIGHAQAHARADRDARIVHGHEAVHKSFEKRP